DEKFVIIFLIETDYIMKCDFDYKSRHCKKVSIWMKKHITIYDIAKKANTSTATVSRVLSNSDYPVKKDLREKILKVAKELNYIPNMIGRQLKTNNSMTIGVIIPSITNPFYASLVLGIEDI